MIVLVLISLAFHLFMIKLTLHQVIQQLKPHLIALVLGFVVFNLIVGMITIFDSIESSSSEVLEQILQNTSQLTILLLGIINIVLCCGHLLVMLRVSKIRMGA
jgi:fructose-specific phosphotransferase system IIC component